jgi:signal transduction histidine kinase
VDARLPAGIEVAAYFVVAESMANVLKHAGAGRAWVRVAHDGDLVRVEVRDDGVGGLDPNAGTGFKGLTDRVGALGGTLESSAGPEGGTVIRAELPLARA